MEDCKACKVREPNPDNMRFLMDLVCQVTDERNSNKVREDAMWEIADLPHLFKEFEFVREYYRDIANHRTDMAYIERERKNGR